MSGPVDSVVGSVSLLWSWLSKDPNEGKAAPIVHVDAQAVACGLRDLLSSAPPSSPADDSGLGSRSERAERSESGRIPPVVIDTTGEEL